MAAGHAGVGLCCVLSISVNLLDISKLLWWLGGVCESGLFSFACVHKRMCPRLCVCSHTGGHASTHIQTQMRACAHAHAHTHAQSFMHTHSSGGPDRKISRGVGRAAGSLRMHSFMMAATSCGHCRGQSGSTIFPLSGNSPVAISHRTTPKLYTHTHTHAL